MFGFLQRIDNWTDTWTELFHNTPCRFEPPPSRFNISIWARALSKHPDKEYAWFILDGISNGFDIGNNGIIPTGKRRKIKITEARV